MDIKKKMQGVLISANENGMTWEEIAETFDHTLTWAWQFCYSHPKKIVLDQRVIDGFRKLGYEIKLVKVGDVDG